MKLNAIARQAAVDAVTKTMNKVAEAEAKYPGLDLTIDGYYDVKVELSDKSAKCSVNLRLKIDGSVPISEPQE